MPMNPLFGKLEAGIKGAVSLLALMPGIALVFGAVVLPPQLKHLVGGLALVLGTVIIFGVVLNRGRIRRTSPQRIGTITAVLAAAGLVAGVFGFNFVDRHVMDISWPHTDPVYLLKPLNPSPELQSLVDQAGGNWGRAIVNPGVGHEVRQLMRAESGTAVWLLTVLLLLTQTFLMTAIVLGAWKASERLKQAPPEAA